VTGQSVRQFTNSIFPRLHSLLTNVHFVIHACEMSNFEVAKKAKTETNKK